MGCRMIERGRSSETESGTRGGGKRGSRILATLQSLYKYHRESPRVLVSPASSILRPWQYKLYYFFSPVHSTLFIILRARGPRGATRLCRMSQLVMRFSVLSLPPCVTTLMHARVVLYFSRELGSSETFCLQLSRSYITIIYYNRNYVVNEAIT